MNVLIRISLPLVLIILSAGLTGCAGPIGDVPSALRVDTGVDPDKQDQYTRFRTTYYFRIMDQCGLNDGAEEDKYTVDHGMFKVRKTGKTKIVNDTVYRFRMTGKASALFNKVNFGSGVLRADQIDPFGSTVDYEDGRFRVKAGYIVRQKELRDASLEEIKELRDLHNRWKDGPGAAELGEVIKNKVKLLNGGGASSITQDSNSPSGSATTANVLCPDGRPIKRSYLLYGPEGVRELDPDERLLMTMSSDSKPLIGMLEELSGRQRKALTNINSGAQVVVEEEAWVAESQDKLKEFEEKLKRNELPNQSPADIVTQLTGNRKSTRTLPQVTQ